MYLTKKNVCAMYGCVKKRLKIPKGGTISADSCLLLVGFSVGLVQSGVHYRFIEN
jgi:hypothetical protein